MQTCFYVHVATINARYVHHVSFCFRARLDGSEAFLYRSTHLPRRRCQRFSVLTSCGHQDTRFPAVKLTCHRLLQSESSRPRPSLAPAVSSHLLILTHMLGVCLICIWFGAVLGEKQVLFESGLVLSDFVEAETRRSVASGVPSVPYRPYQGTHLAPPHQVHIRQGLPFHQSLYRATWHIPHADEA